VLKNCFLSWPEVAPQSWRIIWVEVSLTSVHKYRYRDLDVTCTESPPVHENSEHRVGGRKERGRRGDRETNRGGDLI